MATEGAVVYLSLKHVGKPHGLPVNCSCRALASVMDNSVIFHVLDMVV